MSHKIQELRAHTGIEGVSLLVLITPIGSTGRASDDFDRKYYILEGSIETGMNCLYTSRCGSKSFTDMFSTILIDRPQYFKIPLEGETYEMLRGQLQPDMLIATLQG